MTPIHARYGLRQRPDLARPRRGSDDSLWVALVLLIALVIGVPIYLRGDEAPTGAFTPPADGPARRDSWCPTPEQRERADELIPPPVDLGSGPAFRPGSEPEPGLCIFDTPLGRDMIATEIEGVRAGLDQAEVPPERRIEDAQVKLGMILLNLRGRATPAQEGGGR